MAFNKEKHLARLKKGYDPATQPRKKALKKKLGTEPYYQYRRNFGTA